MRLMRNSNSGDAEQLSRSEMQMDHSVSHISIGATLYVYKTEKMNIAMGHDMYGKGTSVVLSVCLCH